MTQRHTSIIRKIFYLLLINTLTLGPSFGQTKKDHNQGLITINLDMKIESKPILLSQLVDSVEIVPLEFNVNSYVPSIHAVFVSSNYIAISCGADYPNFTSVKLFSRRGDFIRSIGKRGNGPGEFILPENVCIDKNEDYIYIYDWTKGRILRYSIEGQFLNSINIKNYSPSNYFNLSLLRNNKIGACVKRPDAPSDGFYSLIVFDSALNVTDRVLHRENDENLTNIRGSYQSCQQLAENLVFWESLYDTIYYLNSDFLEVQKVCFNSGRMRITPEVRMNREIKIENYYQIDLLRVLGNYIFFHLVYDKESSLMFYKINSNDNNAYLAQEDFKCDTSYFAQYHTSFTNDLYGFEPVKAFYPQLHQNAFVDYFTPENAHKNLDLKCMEKSEVKWPDKRSQVINIIDNYAEYEMPVLLIHHLIKED